MKTFSFLASLCCGILIWVLLPQVISRPEPWDGDLIYYILSLAIPSALIATCVKTPSWLIILGFFSGQTLMLLQINASSPSPFIALGIVFLAGFSLVCCGIPAVLVIKLKERISHHSQQNQK